MSAFPDPEVYARRIWKLVAFLGRYGKQPANVALRMPMSDVTRLAQEVGILIEEEKEAVDRASQGT